MDHPVSYQPAPRTVSTSAAARISSFFQSPLRKSASKGELRSPISRLRSTARPGSSGSGAAPTSASAFAASVGASRAFQTAGHRPSSSGGSNPSYRVPPPREPRDYSDFYVPYHGPISPRPGGGAAEFEVLELDQGSPRRRQALPSKEEKPVGRLGGPYGKAARHSRTSSAGAQSKGGSSDQHALRSDGFGVEGLGIASAPTLPPEAAGRSSELQRGDLSRSDDANERLERFFQHGAASGDRMGSPTDRFRPALGFGLPTAYIHGGNTPRQCDSPPTRMGHLSGLPSLMRADYQETELRRRDGTQPSQQQQHLQQPFSYRGAAAVPRAHGIAPPTSVPSSDLDDSPTLPSNAFTPERRGLGLAPSISSNEGGSAGWTSAFEGGNRSAATSMTSLRAPSMAANASQQGQSKRLLSQSSADALGASGPAARPRARTASSSDVRARAAQVAGSHEAATRAAPTTTAAHAQPSAPAAQVTPPTMWQQGAPVLSPIAASTLGDSSSPGPSSQHQQPVTQSEHVAATAELRDLVLTAEARKKYRLLQQLHLEEANAHAPEHGWYDANSGCERVLMPRPKLKSRTSIDGSSDTHSRRSTYVSVERNRPRPRDSDTSTQHLRRKTESNPDIAAQHLAHERLAQHTAATVPTRRRALTYTDASPPQLQAAFFHHRAPPLPPSALPGQDDRACSPLRGCHPRASGAVDVEGAPMWPRKTHTPTSGGILINPLEASPDLETVIAQGVALDRDREQWRREYARSIGGHEHRRSRSQERRSSSSSTRPRNRRFQWDHNEPLPADATSVAMRGTLELPRGSTTQPRQRTLRYVRSSPQLGEKERERFEPRAPSPPSLVPTSFQALTWRSGRKRAQSMGDDGRHKQRDSGLSGVFRKRRSRATTPSSPVLGSPRTDRDHSRVVSASMATQRRMRNSASWDKAVVAAEQPLHIHASRRQSWRPSSSVGGRSTPAQDRHSRIGRAQLVSDEPVVIGRQPGFDGRAQEPSSDLARSASNSSAVFRFPAPAGAPSTPGTSYGVAFSSPRPDISDNPTPLLAPLRTGAHPTSPTYHRPQNSADLRTLLAEVSAQRAVTEPAHSRSGSGNVKRASHEHHEEVRRLSQSSPPLAPKRTSSLGRRAAAAMAAEVRERNASRPTPATAGSSGEMPKPAPALLLPPLSPTLNIDSTLIDSPFPNQSLPVPPRRVKSSSSSMDHRTPEPASMPTFESGTFGTPYVDSGSGDAGAAAVTTFSAAPMATPTLGTAASRQANASYFGETRATPPQVGRSPLAASQRPARTSPPSRYASSAAQRSPRERGLDPTKVAIQHHRAGLSASSSDSSHSNRSHLPHELWTADDDPDAFAQLFLRRQPGHESMLGVIEPRDRAASASSQGAESGNCDVSPTRPRVDSERSQADSELQEGISTPQQALLRTPRLGDRSVSPRSPFYSSGDEAQDTTFMARMSPGERYRAALSVRRDSDTVSTLVQHYLSPDARTPSAASPMRFDDPSSKLSSPARLGRVSAELPPSSARRVLQTQRSLNALDAHASPSPAMLTPSGTIDFDDYVAPRSSSDQLASARRSSFFSPPSPRRASIGDDDPRMSVDSAASFGVSTFVRPQVWPDPPKSPGGSRFFD